MQPLPRHSGHPFAADNIRTLAEGVDLLQRISDEAYTRRADATFSDGAGTHVRHIIDHYDCFLRGLENGRVDYDSRDRDVELERSREAAIAALEQTMGRLAVLGRGLGERSLAVRQDCGGPEGDELWSSSSVARELQFLVSHTVHHYALVAVMLRLLGEHPDAQFGVSPSTLKHRQSPR